MGLSEREAVAVAERFIAETGRTGLARGQAILLERKWCVLFRPVDSEIVQVDAQTGAARMA